MNDVRRKLTAILVADVQGYTRLMERDDEGTRLTLSQHRKWVTSIARSRGGRVIDTSGDSVLAEFGSVEKALDCAIEFQQKVSLANMGIAHGDRMEHRIGVNIGDVLDDGASIYGDAVNVAARIQELAPPGGICVSGPVSELMDGRPRFRFKFFREQRLKNRTRPAKVFSVISSGAEPDLSIGRDSGGSVGLSNGPGIAVMPFRGSPADNEKQYLGDEIAEDIITRLSRFRSVRVMARATSFFYCNENSRFSRMHEELNVQYVLEGSIQEVGNEVRISVCLVDCESGRQLWADRYVHESNAIGQVQDEVVSQIVGVIENRILKDQGRLSVCPAPTRRRAYGFLARGKQLLAKSGSGDEELAERCFNDAIQCDPGFSRAYGGLAAIYYRRAARLAGSADWEWMIARALVYAERAVQLDRLDGSAHVAAGLGRLLSREFEAARRHYDIAGELNPNDAEILIARAHANTLLGDPEYGLELATRALHLNPVCPPGYMSQIAVSRYFSGRLEEALQSFDLEEATRLETIAVRASAYGHYGDLDAARREACRYLDGIRIAWRGPGAPNEAECVAWLERLLPLCEKRHRDYFKQGLEAAGIGASSNSLQSPVLRLAR